MDCMEGMKQYPDKYFDICIADPPYGIGDKLVAGGTWSVKYQRKGAAWDITPSEEYFNEMRRVSKNYIVWGANYFSTMLPTSRCFIAWVKPNMAGMHTMSDVELAFTSFDTNARSLRLTSQSGEDRIHVCQKPVALYRWLLKNYAKQGDKILDTHLGSGSSRIACYEAGYDFVGYELDKEYFDASEKRFQKYIMQGSIFDEPRG